MGSSQPVLARNSGPLSLSLMDFGAAESEVGDDWPSEVGQAFRLKLLENR